MLQGDDLRQLPDEAILNLIRKKKLQTYKLEEELGDLVRAVKLRRDHISADLPETDSLNYLPYTAYDYSYVSYYYERRQCA